MRALVFALLSLGLSMLLTAAGEQTRTVDLDRQKYLRRVFEGVAVAERWPSWRGLNKSERMDRPPG